MPGKGCDIIATMRLRLTAARSARLFLPLLYLVCLSMAACSRETAGTPVQPATSATPITASVTPLAAPAPPATTSPSPTPSQSATPAIDITQILSRPPLPDTTSPFTGLEVDDPARLDRMPAAVKISNSPIARPQSGLSKADVVIEHLAEGGITRFTAIFHSQEAERIGSIRSARLIDLEIPALFDAFLVYSGASGEVNRMIDSSDFAARTLSDERKDPGFFRLNIPGKTYEHTLFTDTELLQQVAASKGWLDQPRYRGWTWGEQPSPDAQPARKIDIPYSSEYSDVRYVYDAEAGNYRRWILDEPHVDALTGEQLATENVVVLYANHVPTLIVEDVLGSKSIEIQLWGQGRIQVFRDGVAEEGFWVRPKREDPLLFLDKNYEPLPLKPGKTWIEIVPLDMQVTTTP